MWPGSAEKKLKMSEEQMIDRRDKHIRLLREGIACKVMASCFLTQIVI